MNLDLEVICPHCGKQHDIPYEEVRHHVFHIQGKESARKRKDFAEHMAKMHAAHRPRLHPKQQAILTLSQEQNLDTLKLREIADRVGIEGKDKVSRVWQHINALKKKNLLSYSRRTEAFEVQHA